MNALALAYVPLPGALMMAIEPLNKYEAGALVRKRREERGLTQDEVVENTTIPVATYVSELENGKVSVGRSKHFPSLARYLRLSEDDIRSISPSAVFDFQPDASGAKWNGTDRRQGLTLEISHDDLMKLQNQKLHSFPSDSNATLLDIVSIPVYGTASAGSPGDFLAVESIMYHVALEKQYARNGNTIAVAVSGNSMLPRICDKDIVIIDTSMNELQEGKVYLILVEGQGACVKRARHSRGQWWLWSDNADHAPFQAEEASILGMAYRVQRPSEDL